MGEDWLGPVLAIRKYCVYHELALLWEYSPAPVPTDSTVTVAVVLTGGIANTTKDVPDARFLLGREADRAGAVPL